MWLKIAGTGDEARHKLNNKAHRLKRMFSKKPRPCVSSHNGSSSSGSQKAHLESLDIETVSVVANSQEDSTSGIGEPAPNVSIKQRNTPPLHLQIMAKKWKEHLLSPQTSSNKPLRVCNDEPSLTDVDALESSGKSPHTGTEGECSSLSASTHVYEPPESCFDFEFTTVVPVKSASDANSVCIPVKSPLRNTVIHPHLQSILKDDTSSVYSNSVYSYQEPPSVQHSNGERSNAIAVTLPTRNATQTSVASGSVHTHIKSMKHGSVKSGNNLRGLRASRTTQFLEMVPPTPERKRPCARQMNSVSTTHPTKTPSSRLQRHPHSTLLQRTTSISKRASIASSIGSIIPLIMNYAADNSDAFSSPSEPTQAVFESNAKLFEEDDAVSILSNHRQIERVLLSRPEIFEKVKPLDVRKSKCSSCRPCERGVEEYSKFLDEGFSQYTEPEPDYQFREKILRGTSYAVSHRSQNSNKNSNKKLPPLPSQMSRIEEYKGTKYLDQFDGFKRWIRSKQKE